jgi:hypothetical protein
MSGCTITVSNSVRMSAPVGQASRQPAFVQCLHTSDMNSHESSSGIAAPASAAATRSTSPSCTVGMGASASTKRTWRHVAAPSEPVWS